MPVDRDELIRLAAIHGFREATLEKVIRLGEFLAQVGRHPVLRQVLLLKGGTALNLCFGPPLRLSVDLDFNYVGSQDRGVMLEQRPEVERAVRRIAESQDYRIQQSRDEHAGRKFYLGFQSSTGTPDRIEVDINYLHRVPLAPSSGLLLWQPGEFPRPRAAVVGIEELCAGKLCAMLDRALPRDLYDVAHMGGIVGLNWRRGLLRSLFIALAGTLPRPVYEYTIVRLERVTDRDIRSQLQPMLSSTDLTESATSLRSAAWEAVAPLMPLTNYEREFIDRLQVGEITPALLFPEDPGMANRVARHPALLWKAQNARRAGGPR